MDKNKAVANNATQNVIPRGVVEMAKFIQECDRGKKQCYIRKTRRVGVTAAFLLARNNN